MKCPEGGSDSREYFKALHKRKSMQPCPEYAHARLTLRQSSKVLSICFHPFDLQSPSEARDTIISGRRERTRAERNAKETDYAPLVDSMMHCPVLPLGKKDLPPRPLEWCQLTALSSQSLMEISTLERSYLT